MQTPRADVKALLPLSIVVLINGDFVYTSVDPVTVSDAAAFKLRVVQEVGKEAVSKDLAWCNANIKSVIPGLLTMHGSAGAKAGELQSAGIVAQLGITANPAGGLAVTHARVVVPGVGEQVTAIGAALGLVGSPARISWLGGPVAANLHKGAGIPDAAAQNSASVPMADLVGTGPAAVISAAKAGLLGLVSTGGGDPSLPTVAAWLTRAVGKGDLSEAMRLVLTCSAAAIGASVDPVVIAISTARTSVLASTANMLNDMTTQTATEVAARLAVFTSSGMTVDDAAGGTALRAVVAAAPVAAPGPHTSGPPASALIASTPAHAPAPASSTSPCDVLIAQQNAELAALRAAAIGAPIAAPTPAAEPAALVGMATIRPVGGGPAGDLQLFRDVGGERVLASLATVAGNTAAVFIMDGPGSAGTALDAALDFQRVYARACIAHPAPSTHDVYLRPTAPPVNSEEAETRLRSILRLAAETSRAGTAPAAAADIAAAAAPSRRHSSDRPVRSIPLTASTERVWRAVDASIVDKLGAPAEIVKAKAFSALADPVKECRRLIDLHGPPAAATILSSGEADGEVTHDPDPSLPAARTSLASHCKRHHENVVTTSRLRESAADVIALRDGVVSVDVDWELVVKLYGSVQPKPAAWRTSHDASGTGAGRWGSVSGPHAYADSERAARLFGPLFVEILCDVGGAATPGDPTGGLLPFVQSTQHMTDASRTLLVKEAFEKIGQSHQQRRHDVLASPADLEAHFILAAREVRPIEDSDAAAKKGAAAGQAAAAAYMAAFVAAGGGKGVGKRTAPTAPIVDLAVGGADADGVVATGKKQRGKKKAAIADPATPPAPTGQPAAGATGAQLALLGPDPAAAGAAAGAAIAASAKPVPVRVKLEPFGAGEPKPKSITHRLTDDGISGLVQVFDRLNHTEDPSVPIGKLPCPWFAAFLTCKAASNDKCNKCKNKAKASAAVLSKIKAACSADMLKDLAPTSAIATAA